MQKIITVGREFGSGGRERAKRLADELGVAYYDREIITEIAKKASLDENYVAQALEHMEVRCRRDEKQGMYIIGAVHRQSGK